MERLDQVLEMQQAALDDRYYDQFFALDERVHQGIFDAADMGGAWDTASKAQTELYRVRHLKRICTLQRGPTILAEHRDIAEAIRSHDADEAERSLIAHIGSMEQEAGAIRSAPG